MTRRRVTTGPKRPEARTPAAARRELAQPTDQPPGEIGGPTGPEPTRYGDWERNGRVTDF